MFEFKVAEGNYYTEIKLVFSRFWWSTPMPVFPPSYSSNYSLDHMLTKKQTKNIYG